MVRWRPVFGLLCIAMTTASCDFGAGPAGKVCTEIGCSSGLTVHLPSVPTGAYKVELLFPMSDVAYTYECPGTGACKQDIFFETYVFETAIVRVTTTNGVRTTTVSNITYVAHRPNGPDCPPLCIVATVSVPLPP